MKLAIITPAYSRHLPLLDLSAASVDRNCSADIHQYVIVSHQEDRLFRHLRGSQRSVIAAKDVAPRPIFRLPMLVRNRRSG